MGGEREVEESGTISVFPGILSEHGSTGNMVKEVLSLTVLVSANL